MQVRLPLTAAALAAVAALGCVGAAAAHGGADANGEAKNSPGIVSGNLVQAPVDVPVNACGDTVSVVGILNPTFGNICENV
ncbi:chaplin [Streptomyces yokosukanensis]|uniref:Chaplin n=1 Tax=Streptomyces yokosukanensis TaxID=67386 RepID=A0A101NNZ9_9ACTN|nr:chaplin [Streptomyces yokosukanensis]KUM96377.1 chaplin [Streptomyces yokosukanensis]